MFCSASAAFKAFQLSTYPDYQPTLSRSDRDVLTIVSRLVEVKSRYRVEVLLVDK